MFEQTFKNIDDVLWKEAGTEITAEIVDMVTRHMAEQQLS
jgi:hypothetical protein